MPTPIPEPTSTPMAITNFEALAGKWTRIGKGWYLREDVEWRLTIDETGPATIWAPGGGVNPHFSFEDGLLYTIFYAEGGCSNVPGTYEVSGVPGEYLIFRIVDDVCHGGHHLRGKWTAASSQ